VQVPDTRVTVGRLDPSHQKAVFVLEDESGVRSGPDRGRELIAVLVLLKAKA
jgi:hypothetical protein